MGSGPRWGRLAQVIHQVIGVSKLLFGTFRSVWQLPFYKGQLAHCHTFKTTAWHSAQGKLAPNGSFDTAKTWMTWAKCQTAVLKV
jgi:hypothetical protein